MCCARPKAWPATHRHQIDDRQRAAVLDSERFDGHHAASRPAPSATRPARKGLAIIDGQAGTGKSFTMAAIREAYEAAGYRVIGLAPTNAVAQDMRARRLRPRGDRSIASCSRSTTAARNWDSRTVVIVDEAAMLDTKLMAMVTAHAHDAGAKLILVGDDRQLIEHRPRRHVRRAERPPRRGRAEPK